MATEGSKETSEDHDHVSNNGDEDVSTTQTSQEGQVKEQEWGGDAPVYVTCPVDLTVDISDQVWDMLVLFNDLGVFVRDAVTSGHCEVRKEGKGGDECSQDMEHSFLLHDGISI